VLPRTRLVAGTVTLAVLAAAGAAFAAIKLDHATSTSTRVSVRPSPGLGGFGLGGRLGGRGLGGGVGPGGERGLGPPGAGPGLGLGFLGEDVGAVTSYLGIDSLTLRSDLAKGQTLAQIAKARGKTADGLVSVIVSAEKKALDSQVSSGRLSKAGEQQIESRLPQAITALVNGTPPAGGLGRGFFGRGLPRPGASPA
jgi:hypothetical protein